MKRTKQSTFAKRERQEQGAGFAPVGGAQFTPGPWYAANMGNDFQGLVVEVQTGKNIAVAYDKRDVHILAAAPAMYEALVETMRVLRSLRDSKEEWYTLVTPELLNVWDRNKQALAQAEGRQG